jgi:hypothetical protein
MSIQMPLQIRWTSSGIVRLEGISFYQTKDVTIEPIFFRIILSNDQVTRFNRGQSAEQRAIYRGTLGRPLFARTRRDTQSLISKLSAMDVQLEKLEKEGL